MLGLVHHCIHQASNFGCIMTLLIVLLSSSLVGGADFLSLIYKACWQLTGLALSILNFFRTFTIYCSYESHNLCVSNSLHSKNLLNKSFISKDIVKSSFNLEIFHCLACREHVIYTEENTIKSSQKTPTQTYMI